MALKDWYPSVPKCFMASASLKVKMFTKYSKIQKQNDSSIELQAVGKPQFGTEEETSFLEVNYKPEKRTHYASKRWLVTIAILLFTFLVVASPAFANTRNWSFLMPPLNYLINGKEQGILHSMTSGTLTNSGSVWVTYKLRGDLVPGPITIKVYKQITLWPDQLICTVSVTPDFRVGYQYKKSFSKNCGTISSGTYYLVISRNIGGVEVKGEGTLKTP